ncbi:MAG: class I SAM-dependent methyltransferase [Gemmatimonadota bacterium]|nr:class I SAM-dependent methyltransferase [Gemmatimonadota bacterium]
METEKSQESRRLLASVKEKYNDPDELELRLEELKIGLREEERNFVEKYPAGGRLLDIGCATGRLCFALARLGYIVTGIDVAKKQIEQALRIAEKKRINAVFRQYEMPTLPLSDASFAAAFMGNVYCYVPHRASRIAFLEEIARVLYPDGEVLMSQTVLDSVLKNYDEVYDANHHRFAFEYDTLEEGDGFALGAPHYLHFFFADDLIAELEASPFDVANPVLLDEKLTCVLRKQST